MSHLYKLLARLGGALLGAAALQCAWAASPAHASNATDAPGVAASAAGTRLLRFPDVCGQRVVFTYAGDLWTVAATGGTATRLTAGPGLEMSPQFSPDCSQVAFTGQYDGYSEVYVVSSRGGVPRQLTYYPSVGPMPERWGFDNQVDGWTPDGKAVLFRSWRDSPRDIPATRVFTVPVAGGLPTALPMPRSGQAVFSPDGKQVVYSPRFRDFRNWDRYKGGWAQDLYIYDIASRSAKDITNDRYTDRNAVWIGNAIYFLSDRAGLRLNLYRYDTASGKTAQLTHYTHRDARWASGDQSGMIVYELDGSLHLYDTHTGQDRALVIHVPSDLLASRPSYRDVRNHIQGLALGPEGKRAAIVARGDIFSVPLRHGVTVDLTHTPGVFEREVTWSPNGQRVAYVSDQSGEEELWVRNADGTHPVQLTHGVIGRLYAPSWSPDGKHIVFVDNANRLHLIGTTHGASDTVIARDPGRSSHQYRWSPSGRYLAYVLTDKATNQRRVYLYDVATGKATELGRQYFDAYAPFFSPDGKYLFFLGDRAWNPQLSTVESDYATNRTTVILAYALHPDEANPFAPRDVRAGDQSSDAASTSKSDDTRSHINQTIDLQGLDGRLMRVPVPASNIRWLAVTPKAILYLTTGAPFLGRSSGMPMKLHSWSFADRQSRVLYTWRQSGDPNGAVALSGNGSTLLIHDGSRYQWIDVQHPAGSHAPHRISLNGLHMWVDPKAEYAEIFNDVWRRYRDYFHFENMNGYDWKAIRAKYEPLLAYVGDRTDLNYVLGQMIAELSNSHTYVGGGDLDLPSKPYVALLGATLKLDKTSDRYQIATVMPGENDVHRYRSPLTEFGVNVKAGDYILAINGRQLTGHENPYKMLRIARGQDVRLTVNSRPTMHGAREVLVRPVSSEMDLRYYDWVKANRDYVAKASGGKIGYLQIPNMDADGAREFIKWYYPQLRKPGLIIDARYNGGGIISQTIIERLSRKLLAYSYLRGTSITGTYPSATYIGHLAALVNGETGSDGDIFAYMFKHAGLGPLIGTRTWGGVDGILDHGPLIDGGKVFVPQADGIVSLDGKFVVEGRGVKPDIVVKQNVAEKLAGKDSQLDKAIAVLEKKIASHPVSLPPRPAELNKLPPGLRPAAPSGDASRSRSH